MTSSPKGDNLSAAAVQIAFLATLLTVGWAISRLDDAHWLIARIPASQRTSLQALLIFAIALGIDLLFWLGISLEETQIPTEWRWILTQWIHLGALGLLILQIPATKATRWGLLFGAAWILPAIAPSLRALMPSPISGEPWSLTRLLGPACLVLASYLLALSKDQTIRN